METPPHANIDKGTFLIATPDIDSGLFYRAVVLVCEHNASGSFGLIVNKNIDLELPEEILNMQELANPRVGVRAGGPVQPNQMMLLHSSDRLQEQSLKICNGVYLGGDLAFLQESIADPSGPCIRLCFGYAGWSAGQLEREFLDGGWLISRADHHRLFNIPSEKLWQLLLREMGGKYATLSMIPEDLSLN
jgi:putative transcriptional regulator